MTPDPGEPGPGPIRSRAKATLPVVRCIFEPGADAFRYLTGVVVEHPDGTREQRELKVEDWIVLGLSEPVGSGYLSKIRKYLAPDWESDS